MRRGGDSTSNVADSHYFPAMRNGTAIPCSTMRKVKNASAMSSESGVYSNTIQQGH